MPDAGGGSQADPPTENTVALLGAAYSILGHEIVAGVAEAGFPQRPAHSGVFAHIDIADEDGIPDLQAVAILELYIQPVDLRLAHGEDARHVEDSQSRQSNAGESFLWDPL